MDSTIIKDGRFTFSGKLAAPAAYAIVIDKTPKGDKSSEKTWLSSRFYLENSNIIFTGDIETLPPYYYSRNPSIKQAVIKGSAEQDEYVTNNTALADINKELGKVNTEYLKAYHVPAMEGKFNTEEGIALARKEDSLSKLKHDCGMAYIAQHPASAVAYDIAYEKVGGMFISITEKQIDDLTAMVRKGWDGTPNMAMFEKAAKKAKETAIGTKYQDFEMTTPDGKKAMLSEFVPKGKYVMLEFWASWCGPCRGEIPHLKHLHETKSQLFDIVSISLDESDKDWKKARAGALMDGFIKNKGKGWQKSVALLEEISKVSKEDVTQFANRFFGDNYLALYKRKAEDSSTVKVEKPPITPVETNAGKQSPYVTMINALPATAVQPQWLNFDKDIQKTKIGGADLLYVQNNDNQLFRLYYRFDMGSWNNKLLPLAASYLSFLSTDKYSAEQISKEFYNIACSFSINAGTENTTVIISGLQENFDKAVKLFEHVIANSKPNEEALTALKGRLEKSRTNSKLNKGAILQGLMSYAGYGANNPFNYTLSNEEIKALKAEDLVNTLHGLMDYKHSIIYYGPQSLPQFTTTIKAIHTHPAAFTATPAAVKFERAVQTSNKVLFADYDMVQAEIIWYRNASAYDPQKEATIDLFNGYFGGGMGSIVFQTLRESKALAYATSANYSVPSKKEDPFSIVAYVGSQADKMNDAVTGMNELLNDLPQSEKAFETAKMGLKNDLETQRITQDGIIFTYLAAQRKGLDYDLRKEQYDAINRLTFADIKNFHGQELSKKPFTYCVVASEKKINVEDLKKLGEVNKLSLEEIFGY